MKNFITCFVILTVCGVTCKAQSVINEGVVIEKKAINQLTEEFTFNTINSDCSDCGSIYLIKNNNTNEIFESLPTEAIKNIGENIPFNKISTNSGERAEILNLY